MIKRRLDLDIKGISFSNKEKQIIKTIFKFLLGYKVILGLKGINNRCNKR